MSGLHGVARLVPVVGIVAALGAAAYLVVPGLGDDPAPGVGAPPAVGTPWPETWPASVRPLADAVEEERGLRFRHPVEVRFLPPRQFRAQVTTKEDELTAEDRKEVRASAGFLRALGLLDGDADLVEQANRLHGAGVIGLYSYDDQTIRVRGTRLTPAVRSTLVHELTHALQDQHFAIGDRAEELAAAEDSSAASAYQALVEGDASRVEAAWVAGLPRARREALAAELAEQTRTFREQSDGVPPVLVTLLGAPYALGESMLGLATALDGEGAVDRLFDDPPTTDEQLLDPWTLLVDDAAGEPVDVDPPALADGEERLDSGTFGALGWYVVLAQHLDPHDALEAADGWGGDAYTAVDAGGRSCVRVAYRGDTPADVDQLADALARWSAASPVDAEVVRDGDGLVLSSCQPETAAPPSLDQDDVLRLPVVRTAVTAQVLAQGGAPGPTRCFVERAVDELTVAQLTEPDPDADPAATARAQEIAQECAG